MDFTFSDTIAGYVVDFDPHTRSFGLRTTDGKFRSFDPPGSVATEVSSINANGTVTTGKQPRRKYPKVVPKYFNPLVPMETWSGRGKQPRWLVAALQSGHKLEEFRIPDTEEASDHKRPRRPDRR